MSNFTPGGGKEFSPPNAKPVSVRQNSPMPLGPMRSVRMPESPVPNDSPAPVPISKPQAQPEPSPQLAGRGRGPGGSSSPFWGQQEAPPAQPPPQLEGGHAQVHQFEVLGEGPDGSQQSFIHEVEFPGRVRVLGIRHLSSG